MIIEKFVSPEIIKNEDGLDYLKCIHDDFKYASRGRWALYHCLKANRINEGFILLPAFACETILEPIKLLNLEPIFYDIDLEDLNPSIESIKKLIIKNNIQAVLVVSMYGNPANLLEIENLLNLNNIVMIDDAAQAFGARLNNRYVGTFGDSGFFSFSPGKSTVAHLGAFFWTKGEYTFNYRSNFLIHYLLYLEYYFNRYKTYTYNKYFIFKFLKIFRILLKIFDIKNDKIENFERKILGGVIYGLLNNKFKYRTEFIEKISYMFKKNNSYRLIKAIRGNSHTHKVVIVSISKELTEKLMNHLFKNKIYVQFSYKPLSTNIYELKNLELIKDKIIEIPIDPFLENRNYLYIILKNYMEKYHEHN